MLRIFSILLYLFLCCAPAPAQQIFSWRSHLSHHSGIALIAANQNLLYISASGITNPADGTELTKINALQSIDITTAFLLEPQNLLLLGSKDGLIEIVPIPLPANPAPNQAQIITDIKEWQGAEHKQINRFAYAAPRLAAATNFGIIEINPNKAEITRDFSIHPSGKAMPVRDLALFGSHWIAAADTGILYCSTDDSQWFYYARWQQALMGTAFQRLLPLADTLFALTQSGILLKTANLSHFDTLYIGIKNIALSGNNLWVSADSITFNHTTREVFNTKHLLPQDIKQHGGYIWIADSTKGLWRCLNNECHQQTHDQLPSREVLRLAASGNSIWAAGKEFVCKNENSKWLCHYDAPISTPAALLVNPKNEAQAWAADTTKIILYDGSGGQLVILSTEDVAALTGEASCRLTSLEAAQNGDRLAGIAGCEHSLLLIGADGTTSFPLINGIEYSNIRALARYGNIFRGLTADLPSRIFALQSAPERSAAYEVALRNDYTAAPVSASVIAIDRSGEAWLGTNKGAAAYPASAVWAESAARKVQTKSEMQGYVAYLLEYETITAILSDGGSRKWFGTQAAGALLQSADGSQPLRHFTASNSPLPANQVNAIAVNARTGEVFIATPQGVVGYIADATKGEATFSNVKIYPNPVRPSAQYLTITGLVEDAQVKITDASGRLIYSGIANGGSLAWDLQAIGGQGRAETGVYIVFMVSADGSQQEVGKVAIIK